MEKNNNNGKINFFISESISLNASKKVVMKVTNFVKKIRLKMFNL